MDDAQIETLIGGDPAMREAIVNAGAIFAVDCRTTTEYMIFGPDLLDDLDDDADVMVFTVDARKGDLDELLDLLKSLRPGVAAQCRARRFRRGGGAEEGEGAPR